MFRFFTCFTHHTHGRTRPKFNMPPKKKAKTLEGQQKLTFSAFSNSNERHRNASAGDFVPLAAEAAQASAIDSAPSSSNLSTASNQTKARKFFSSWMKMYSWLAYDEKRRLYICTAKFAQNTRRKMECAKWRTARISKTQRSSDVLHSAITKWLCRNRRYQSSLKLLKKKPNHSKTKLSWYFLSVFTGFVSKACLLLSSNPFWNSCMI